MALRIVVGGACTPAGSLLAKDLIAGHQAQRRHPAHPCTPTARTPGPRVSIDNPFSKPVDPPVEPQFPNATRVQTPCLRHG